MTDELKDEKLLTDDEKILLEKQNTRLVPEYKASILEKDAKRFWDLFYKRNETRFFKDRHWTTREFKELVGYSDEIRILLEVGCGVGNFAFPLLEDGLNLFIYACDFSLRAVDFVKSHGSYDEGKIRAFQCDITTNDVYENIKEREIDIVTMIFVLSAIHPDKFRTVIENVFKALKPGGIVLFRDYGLYDMAQLRFKPGHKISNNFYMRQDGTRLEYLIKIF